MFTNLRSILLYIISSFWNLFPTSEGWLFQMSSHWATWIAEVMSFIPSSHYLIFQPSEFAKSNFVSKYFLNSSIMDYSF